MKEKFAITAVSFLEKLELEDLDQLEPEARMLLEKISSADEALQAEGWDSRAEQQFMLEQAVLSF